MSELPTSPARQHIYLSSNSWEGLWIIQQPIAQEVARTEHLLYVERFVSLFTILRYPSLWRRLFRWMGGARNISTTLRVLAPLPLFHLGHRFPWLFRLEFSIQRRWIEWWVRPRTNAARILWMDNPLYESAVGEMGEALSVYHVADEISEFPTSHRAITEALEQRMLRKVDLVFAAAEELSKDKRQWQPQTYTVWNAIDTTTFAHAKPGDPPRLAAIPSPRVIFVGVIDAWVDLELLRLAATRLPHIHFVLVGPAKVSTARLEDLPNVHLVGRVARGEVPGLLRSCSASLVPFHKTKLTARIVPLKIFEALAAGIMPVCTDFSIDLAALQTAKHARVGRTADEFIRAVDEAVRADTPVQRQALQQYGLQQTWQTRWNEMSQVIHERLNEKRAANTAARQTTGGV